VAKGLIDHIRITDEHGDYLPNDVVSYAQYESEYEPREGAAKGRPDYFAGQYLEQPVQVNNNVAAVLYLLRCDLP